MAMTPSESIAWLRSELLVQQICELWLTAAGTIDSALVAARTKSQE